MKIYTRTGDGGETGLFGGPRLAKDAPRIAAYGTVDELNAQVGLARCEDLPRDMDEVLRDVQNRLFQMGAELATPDAAKRTVSEIGGEQVAKLEAAIDRMEAALPKLTEFILPAGCPAAAQLHVARTVCRRAERALVTLSRDEPLTGQLLAYLNRLSDLLFVMARAANANAGHTDVPWDRGE